VLNVSDVIVLRRVPYAFHILIYFPSETGVFRPHMHATTQCGGNRKKSQLFSSKIDVISSYVIIVSKREIHSLLRYQ